MHTALGSTEMQTTVTWLHALCITYTVYNVASVNTMQYIVLIINALIEEGMTLFCLSIAYIVCPHHPYIESWLLKKSRKVRLKFVTSCWLVVVLMQYKVPQVEYTHCFARHQNYKNCTSLIHISTPLAQIININLLMRVSHFQYQYQCPYTDFNYCSKLFIACNVSPLYQP